MRRILGTLVLVFAVLFTLFSNVAWAESGVAVRIVPDDTTVTEDTPVSVAVTVANVTNLAGFSVEIEYDPTILAISGTLEPGDIFSHLTEDQVLVASELGSGTLTYTAAIKDATQAPSTGNGVLFTIPFHAIATGTVDIAFKSNSTLAPNGLVLGEFGGTEITANTIEEATITVQAYVPTESVTLDNSTLELAVGDNATLNATVAPVNATDKSISWTSSDSTVVSVDQSGQLTANAAGIATITSTTVEGYTAQCLVTVVVPVTGVSLDQTQLVVAQGQTSTLTATIAPVNATNTAVTWASSDETVATVTSEGVVTAVGTGEATITVQTNDNAYTATCDIRVGTQVLGQITLDGETDHSSTTVILLNGDTIVDTTTTDPNGNYLLWATDSGSYTVQVQNSGWSYVEITNVAVVLSDISTTAPTKTLYLGDMNADGYINVTDILLVVPKIDLTSLDNDWVEWMDLNDDNVINLLDIMVIVGNLGQRP